MIFDIIIFAIIVLALLWKFKGMLGQETETDTTQKNNQNNFESIKNVTGTVSQQPETSSTTIKKMIGIQQKQPTQSEVNLNGFKFNVSQNSKEQTIKEIDKKLEELANEEVLCFTDEDSLSSYQSLPKDISNIFVPTKFLSIVKIVIEEMFEAISSRKVEKLTILSDILTPNLFESYISKINNLNEENSFIHLVKIKSAKISSIFAQQNAISTIKVTVEVLTVEYSLDSNENVSSGSKKEQKEQKIELTFQTISLVKQEWKIVEIL